MKTRALTFLCVLGAALPEARADTAMDDANYELTLPKGRFVIDAYLEINLSKGAAFEPTSLSPDVWYGITDDLTVGVVHSANGTTGFVGGFGQSLCLTGTNHGCAHFYQNVGADVRYKLLAGNFSWAADGGLIIQNFDPFELALKIGAVGRWHRERFAVELEPALFFGLTNRSITSGGVTVTTNGDALSVPVTGFYSFTPQIALALQTGLILPFQNTGDTWAIPLSIGVHYLVMERLNVNLAFSLTRLIGGSSADAFDGRALTIGGSYAL